MPRDDGLGLHDDQRFTPAGPATAKGDPEQAIFGLEREAAYHPIEYRDLLAKGQILEDQVRARAAKRSEGLERDIQQELRSR